MISASATASAISSQAERRSFNGALGRKSQFTCSRLIDSTTSGSRAQIRTEFPRRARRSARVVPQLPAPTTAIFTYPALPRFPNRFSCPATSRWMFDL